MKRFEDEIVVWDLDDTLVDFVGGLTPAMNERFGTSFPDRYLQPDPDQWKQVLTKEQYDGLWELICEPDFNYNLELIDGAQEVVKKIGAVAKKMYVATARKPSAAEHTLKTIQRNFNGYFTDVFFTGVGDGTLRVSKADIGKKVGASIAFEDHKDHIVRYSQAGIHTHVPAYPHNRGIEHDPNVTRHKDYLTFLQELKNGTSGI